MITPSPSSPYWLPGNNTVELTIDVRGTGTESSFADNFVVHYHPVSDGGGSQCHSKPYSGNLTTPRDYMNKTSHWLFGASVPSLAKIQDMAAKNQIS